MKTGNIVLSNQNLNICKERNWALLSLICHYENMPMQYTGKVFGCKNENFHWKNIDIFLIFAQNIDCEYTLEPPRRGGSNVYPQSMF